MIRTTVKAFNRFPEITARVERASVIALDEAAREAAAVAQANATLDLEIALIPAHGEIEGYSAGIKSRRQSDVEGSTTTIATFFDGGTLGNRNKPLKRPRKTSWTEKKKATEQSYTATRGNIGGKGIKPQKFFAKARTAGRRKLLATLDEQVR